MMGRRVCGLFSYVVMSVSGAAVAQFTDVTDTAGLAVVGVRDGAACFGDVDRDGDYDVYVPRDSGSALFLNDGAGVFQDVTATAISGLTGRVADFGCVFADLNNDGWVDLARTGPEVLEVYLNQGGAAVTFGDGGAPNFVIDSSDGTADPFTVDLEGISVLDYDNDDLLDLVLQNEGGVRIMQNDGTGEFSLVAVTGLPEGSGGDGDYLAVADVDLDGDVDIIPRLSGGADLFLNGADGTFTGAALNLPADAVNKGGAIVCDFDNDGRFDLFFTDGDQDDPIANRVLLQDASGGFNASADPNITGVNVEGGACGDVDHDGDVDLAVNVFTETRLYVNQLIESGSFSLARDDRGIAVDTRSRGISLTDVDGDGDLDLYAMKTGSWNGSNYEDGPNSLFRNDIDNANYLLVRVLADVGACPGGQVLREDLGATVQLLDMGGAVLGTREISGGADRSRTEAAVAHFGIPGGPAATYQVRVRFQVGDEEVTLPVVPSTLGSPQQLDVVSTDPDGDTILTEVEMQDASANPDLDGDGLVAWLDADADGDGVPDAMEAGDVDPCTAPVDADATGVPDYLEAASGPVDGGAVDGGDAGAGAVDGGPATGTPEGGTGVVPLTPGADLRGGGVGSCAVGAPVDFGWIVLAVLSIWRRRRRHAG